MTDLHMPLWWRRLRAVKTQPGATQAHSDARQASSPQPPTRRDERDTGDESRRVHEEVLAWLTQERLREARAPLTRL
jgi:hypothetical protein